MPAPITQEQLGQLLADAKLGRALRDAAQRVGRQLAEDADLYGVEEADVGSHIADYLFWEDSVLASEGAAALRDIVAAAAQEVADERQESARDHAEADKDIARSIR